MIGARAGRARVNIRGVMDDAARRAEYVARVAGEESVAYLRSLTDEMRPPVRKGEGARRAHPGGWADVRGTLALGYAYEVEALPTGARLRMLNPVEYAVYLDVRENFYVLRGFFDEFGSGEYAPGLEIVRRVAADNGFGVR
jgi:hypothetical protein